MAGTIRFPAEREDRLDVLLAESAGITRSRAAALIRDGRVTVEGELPPKAGFMVKAGRSVEATIPDPVPARAEAQEIALDVLYQDASGGGL
jgi:23S rRNA pseudouridine1911/1915/1917 synthase